MSKVQSAWLDPTCITVVGVVRLVADPQITDLQKSTQPPGPKGHEVKVCESEIICRSVLEIVVIKELNLSKVSRCR
jgi:hypothetical protein